MDRLDYYGCLEIERDASQEEIKRAYRRMVRLSHPDLNPDDSTAADRLQSIIAAYRVLGDPFSRARYDRVDFMFGPRRICRDEVTERKSAFWEERLYQQSLRPRSIPRRKTDSRKPFIAGVLLLCLILILTFYTFESDWFTSNPLKRTPKWRMPVETLKTNTSYKAVRAARPEQDWGIQYWICEYKMNQHSEFVRAELAKSFARFAANEFGRGNVDVALDSAKTAARICPDLGEADRLVRLIESMRLGITSQDVSQDES